MNKILLSTTLCLLTTAAVQADEEVKSKWSGSTGYLGFSTTSGNSDTENLTAGLKVKYETGKWISDMGLDVLRASSNDTDTAERYVLSSKTGYKFNDKNYLYYSSRYEKDNFSAFDYTTTVGIGWGHKFYDSDTSKLITEIGAGYKVAAFDIDRSESSGLALLGKLDYMRQITETMKFIDVAILESTDDNTYIQNDAGLSLKVNDKANVNFVYQIKHNTDVPNEFNNTDTLFSVNLSYTF